MPLAASAAAAAAAASRNVRPQTGYVCFDRYHEMLCTAFRCDKNTYTRFTAGAAAGATAVAITYPFDLLRARMAAHWDLSPRYSSYGTAVRRIVASPGGWRNMYNGLRPTLLGIVPYAGLSFMTFETLKAYALRRHGGSEGDEDNLPVAWRLACGGLAGLLSQSATYPLDIVRRRMQVASASQHQNLQYSGVLDALRKIARSEGVAKGLYKGLSMNWMKGPIAVAISFTVNDVLKGKIQRWHNSDSVMFG